MATGIDDGDAAALGALDIPVLLPRKLILDRIDAWLYARANEHEYAYYLAQREKRHDDAARIKIEFCNEIKRACAVWSDEAALRSADDGRAGGAEGQDGRASCFPIGARVRKIRGSSWQGHVVGHYATALTPDGVCVESEREPGSVQIYPVMALEQVEVPAVLRDLSDGEKQARAAALADAYRREAEARGERPDSFFARWEPVIKGPPFDPPPPDTDTAGRTEP